VIFVAKGAIVTDIASPLKLELHTGVTKQELGNQTKSFLPRSTRSAMERNELLVLFSAAPFQAICF